MGKTLELGRRIELKSMDPHCQNISLGLYCRDVDGKPQFLVHSYASVAAVAERVEFVTRALTVMVGLEPVSDAPGWIRFSCGCLHKRALKLAFLDLCKLESNAALKVKPLKVFDKKAGCDLTGISLGAGVYQIVPEQQTESGQKRAKALARGFAKLCEMTVVEGPDDQVVFSCQASHDELIGSLMFRAQNVRAALREEEQAASRGRLDAPSQQK